MEISGVPEENSTLSKHEVAAFLHLSDFPQKLKDNPDEAIEEIVDRYNNALDEGYTNPQGINNRDYVEMLGGGPLQLIPSIVYNSVGEAYPNWSRPQKDRALKQIFRILDRKNTLETRRVHTSTIRDPQLLSDILVCRIMYLPDLYDSIPENSLKSETFGEIWEEIIDNDGLFKKDKVTSDFLAAYILLRKDIKNFGEEYTKVANPQFLNKVLKGIAAIESRPDRKQRERGKEAKDIYPDSIYKEILKLQEKPDWADYRKFLIK